MYSSGTTRGEKLSTLKLTVVQYGILLMMLALVAGLWRLQVLEQRTSASLPSRTAFARFR